MLWHFSLIFYVMWNNVFWKISCPQDFTDFFEHYKIYSFELRSILQLSFLYNVYNKTNYFGLLFLKRNMLCTTCNTASHCEEQLTYLVRNQLFTFIRLIHNFCFNLRLCVVYNDMFVTLSIFSNRKLLLFSWPWNV